MRVFENPTAWEVEVKSFLDIFLTFQICLRLRELNIKLIPPHYKCVYSQNKKHSYTYWEKNNIELCIKLVLNASK